MTVRVVARVAVRRLWQVASHGSQYAAAAPLDARGRCEVPRPDARRPGASDPPRAPYALWETERLEEPTMTMPTQRSRRDGARR